MSNDGDAGLKIKIPNFEFEAYVRNSEVSQVEERKKLSIKKTAHRDGLKDLPPEEAEAGELTFAEESIIGHLQGKFDVVAQMASHALSYLQDILQNAYMTSGDPDYGKVQRKCELEIEEIKQLTRNDLVDNRREEREKYRYLNFFQKSNGLNREAEYPTSTIFSIGVLVTMVILESLGNAYFFAIASDQGLFGGAMLAFLLSAANVSLSFFIGYKAYTGLNYRAPSLRLWSLTAIAFHALVIVVINLAAAHYRDLIAINPDVDFEAAVARLGENWFKLESLEAILLFVIGVVVSAVAVWKGFVYDDRFPGYGRADRRYKRARKSYRDSRDAIIKKANESFSGAFEEVDEMLRSQIAKTNKANRALSDLKLIYGIFVSAESRINGIIRSFLVAYRQENCGVRGAPPPPYFKTYFPEVKNSFPSVSVSEHESRVEELNRSIERWGESANETKDQLKMAIANLREEMSLLIGEAELAAIKEIEKDQIDLQRMGDGGYILEKKRMNNSGRTGPQQSKQ